MTPANNVNITLDKENDILSVLLKSVDPSKTKNVDIAQNVVARLRYPTNEIVGFIVQDFSIVCHDWKDLDDWHLMEKFDALIEGLNNLQIKAIPCH